MAANVESTTNNEEEEELEETEENTTTSAALEMLVNVPSTSFVHLAGHRIDDELEEDVSFLDEIGRLFDSRETSTLFPLHHTKLFSDYNETQQSLKRRIEQKNFHKNFYDFISMKFLITMFLSASCFINFGDFCQPPRLLHPLCLLFWPKFPSPSI